MIRRLFWMIAGALLGVTGYRRVSRLARAIAARGRTHRGRTHRDGAYQGWTRSAALFAHDVREGMELYADRHPRLAGRTLEGQQARAERRHQAGAGGGPRWHHPGVDYAKEGR